MADFRIKFVGRRDTIQGFYRLVRVMWERGSPGFGGYSAKFTVAFQPAFFRCWKRDAATDWRLTFLGLRLHYCRSYGGRFI